MGVGGWSVMCHCTAASAPLSLVLHSWHLDSDEFLPRISFISLLLSVKTLLCENQQPFANARTLLICGLLYGLHRPPLTAPDTGSRSWCCFLTVSTPSSGTEHHVLHASPGEEGETMKLSWAQQCLVKGRRRWTLANGP